LKATNEIVKRCLLE